MCYVCAGGCDAAAEGAAYMSLLQEYVEAAYLLPEDAHLGEGVVERDIEGRKLPADSEMTGCIRLFRHAMLPPQPLHTRLTSCACLLRAWAAETAGPASASKPFLAWVSQAGVISNIYDCLQAGLQVGLRLRFQFGSLYQYPSLARAAFSHFYAVWHQEARCCTMLKVQCFAILATCSAVMQANVCRLCHIAQC